MYGRDDYYRTADKFCKDCKHCGPSRIWNFFNPVCYAVYKANPITGEKSYYSAGPSRTDGGHCGKEAIRFEPK